jgi:prepilin-type processing-associated H-X9-DG protein
VPGDWVGLGSKYGWGYSHGMHMMIDEGYLGEENRRTNPSYETLAALASSTILGCPNGYAPRDGTEDYFSEAPVLNNYDKLTRLMQPFEAMRHNGIVDPDCGTYWTGHVGTTKKALMAYTFAYKAGSFSFYGGVEYPRKRWKNDSNPDRIAALFESNTSAIGAGHMHDAYSSTDNNDTWGGVGFFPTYRHRRNTTGNVGYADGHLDRMHGFYYDSTTGMRRFPFLFE